METSPSTIRRSFSSTSRSSPPSLDCNPVERAAKAWCRQLELESDEVHFAPVRDLIGISFYPRQRGESPDEEQVRELQSQIATYHTRLSGHLGEQEFLCGEFGIADVSHYLTTYFAAGFGAPVDPVHANLVRWQQRVASRPSVARDVDGMTKALAQSLAVS